MQKGTYAIRQVWILHNSSTVPIRRTKWDDELDNNQPENWKFRHTLPPKCKIDAHTRFSHFQVVHRTPMTNKKLHQFNLRNNNLCTSCKTKTISHLLYECNKVNDLWQEIQTWMVNNFTSTIYLDKKSVLIGNAKNEPIINTLSMIAKHEIFKSKCKGKTLHIFLLKTIFKTHMQIEIYLGTIKHQLAKFLIKSANPENCIHVYLLPCLPYKCSTNYLHLTFFQILYLYITYTRFS